MPRVPAHIKVALAEELKGSAENIKAALAEMRKGWTMIEDGERVWVKGALAAAKELGEARRAFRSNKAFGLWCDSHGFGAKTLNRNDRAALLAFGENPNLAKEVLARTRRQSLQLIYANEWPHEPRRPPRARKTLVWSDEPATVIPMNIKHTVKRIVCPMYVHERTSTSLVSSGVMQEAEERNIKRQAIDILSSFDQRLSEACNPLLRDIHNQILARLSELKDGDDNASRSKETQ
jgi:hypothetical protein